MTNPSIRRVLLPLRGQYAPQLQMNAGVIGPLRREPAQRGLGFAQATGLHVQVGQPDGGFRGVWIEVQNFLVFRFGLGEFLLPFVQQTGRKMGLGILRRELGGFAVRLERVFRLGIFRQMRKSEAALDLIMRLAEARAKQILATSL